MTYGQLKFQLTQQFPSISLDLIEAWIGQRYAEVLGELPWSRLEVQSALQVPGVYSTGTVSITNGSAAITLTAGTWTAAMSGRAFRIKGDREYYQFTFGTGTTGTLDRPYDGTTAAAAGYSIFQTVYVLPSDCRLLADDAFGSMARTSHGQLDQSDPWRELSGTPTQWASYMDDGNTPPNMQVELYPVPATATSILFTYFSDGGDLTDTSSLVQVWAQPTALVEGVVARARAHMKDYAGAAFAAGLAKAALANMRTSEAQGMGPAQLQMDSYYTRHRRNRWCR